jgi:predicted nucleic acid-binding protein
LNGHYFDAAYIAKCYLHEPDAAAVRALARSSPSLYTSALSIAEVACVFHRHVREGTLKGKAAAQVRDAFREDLGNDTWVLVPVTDLILRRVEILTRTLPSSTFLRAGDAIHIVSAIEAGFHEIWTNDRHFLAATAHFGLHGRSVESL